MISKNILHKPVFPYSRIKFHGPHLRIAQPSAHPPALPGELDPVDGDSDPEGGLVRRPALLQQSVHQARLILRIVTFQCLVDIGAIYTGSASWVLTQVKTTTDQ